MSPDRQESMIIGGFQKNTLIDFPSTLSCLVFTRGCNFYCPYCHNPGLVDGSRDHGGNHFTQQDILSFLKTRKGLLDGVAITGGEPCLQPGLENFCRTVKQMGFKVKLDTNGSCPDIIKSLLDKALVDYIAMDIKTSPDLYHLVARHPVQAQIQESITTIMSDAPGYEFRTTCAAPFITPAVMDDICRLIKGARLYVLQKCSRQVEMLDPAFASKPANFYEDSDIDTFRHQVQPHVEACIVR